MFKTKGRINVVARSACRVELKEIAIIKRPYLYDLFLKPYRGKPDVRNFREGAENVYDGGTRNPPHISKECVIRKFSTIGSARLHSTRLN
jgi:hypothetical protein